MVFADVDDDEEFGEFGRENHFDERLERLERGAHQHPDPHPHHLAGNRAIQARGGGSRGFNDEDDDNDDQDDVVSHGDRSDFHLRHAGASSWHGSEEAPRNALMHRLVEAEKRREMERSGEKRVKARKEKKKKVL